MISFLSEYVGSISRKGVHFTTIEVSVLVICLSHPLIHFQKATVDIGLDAHLAITIFMQVSTNFQAKLIPDLLE